MLIGSHVIIHAKDVERTRAFFRDVLGFAHVDAGEGWLIFALPPAELGVHPAETGGRHQLFLMCDDVEKTQAELTAKGVVFTQPVTDQGWGIVTAFELPGAGEFWIYQPRHPMPRRPAATKSSSAASHRKEKKVSGTTRRTGRKSQQRLEAKLAAKRRRRRRR
jgi:catechol 2,3-dioxygenase-like lactoylglutathione lyase family enzyme